MDRLVDNPYESRELKDDYAWGKYNGFREGSQAQDTSTLKEVGEWLNRHWTVHEADHIKDARFANMVIEALLRGEMPKEARKLLRNKRASIKATLARMPVIDDPIISEALAEMGES